MGSNAQKTIRDGLGSTFSQRLVDLSGSGAGPYMPAFVSVDEDGNFGVSPKDKFGSGTREYNFAAGTRTVAGLNSSTAVAIGALGPSRELMLHCSVRCFVRFGDSNVAPATLDAGQLCLEARERFTIRVPEGVTHFRVVRDDAFDGNLIATPVL